MRKIKIGQIGIAHDHASVTFKSLLDQSDIFEVVGYCIVEGDDCNCEKLTKLDPIYKQSKCMSLEELLATPGLEAVTIETVDWMLTKYAQIAVDRGLAVHMDKPGNQDHQAYIKLMETCKQKGTPMQVGYMYRYNPMIKEVIRAAKAGELGEIYCVETHMDCEHPADKRQWLANFKGGMMYFLGCHLVDLILQIQGEPEEILPLNTCSGFDGVTGEDFGMAVFKYKNGYSFAKTTAVEPGGFLRRTMVVCGSKKTVELHPLEQYVENGILVTKKRECIPDQGWNTEGSFSTSEPINRYDTMLREFAAMARGEMTSPYSLDYEIKLHEILLKACGAEV